MNSNDPQDLTIDTVEHFWFDRSRLSALPALLVGVYEKPEELPVTREHLDELKLLAITHGIMVKEAVAVAIRTFSASTFLSTGKLEEVRQACEQLGCRLVIFDDEISPAQQRNLEKYFRIPVIDRTEVILGVFADRAKTREAKLQIELAKTKYLAPRLKHMWSHFSQQRGGGGVGAGGGYLKGEGEKQLEIDRRLLKARVERLQKEIAVVRKQRSTQRHARERRGIPLFAIVGYTNAGKSTLMKALTHADVLIEDKLFATLDTTTRKFILPGTKEEVLFIDTVGFIRKLPHLLVMAFKSTLEEACLADVLIHVIDASHHMAPEQAATTLDVLKELHASHLPVITVFNKMDRLEGDIAPLERRAWQKLRLTYPRSVELSALTGKGLDDLLVQITDVLKDHRTRLLLRIPQSDYHMISRAMEHGKVLQKAYDGNDVLLEVELPIPQSYQFQHYEVTP